MPDFLFHCSCQFVFHLEDIGDQINTALTTDVKYGINEDSQFNLLGKMEIISDVCLIIIFNVNAALKYIYVKYILLFLFCFLIEHPFVCATMLVFSHKYPACLACWVILNQPCWRNDSTTSS